LAPVGQLLEDIVLLKLFIFVLILITLVLLSIFIDGVLEIHKQEKEDKKNFIRDGMEG
jgi:regulatory protein YycI of two-component signal transduction system YycFG